MSARSFYPREEYPDDKQWRCTRCGEVYVDSDQCFQQIQPDGRHQFFCVCSDEADDTQTFEELPERWWVIEEAALRRALEAVASGDSPGIALAELTANSRIEDAS